MERKGFSKSDKTFVEEHMSTEALSKAKGWLDFLHDAEFRGRKDTDGAARYRLAKSIGVKESYLYRLQYRAAEMKDVAGEVYRRLEQAYVEACEANEKAAAAYRAERLKQGKCHEIDAEPVLAGLRTDTPRRSAGDQKEG